MDFPSGHSHWDKLPNEIKDAVHSLNTPLRLFLRGLFKPDPLQEAEEIHKIWMDVFNTDWPGDLSQLPEPKNNFQIKNADLARVKSRSMYERLCVRFLKSTETNTEFANTDRRVGEAVRAYETSETSVVYVPENPFRLLHIPMRQMWLDLLGDTLDKFPYARANDCIIEGHIDLLCHLVDIDRVNVKCIRQVCENTQTETTSRNAIGGVAVRRGYLDVLKMLHEAGCHKPFIDAMDYVAGKGHLEAIKWLHENRTEGCTSNAMDSAARSGHLDVVKFLSENRNEGCTTDAMDWAAAIGRLDIVKFLHDSRTEGCTTKAMNEAAARGRLDVVKWLHENRTEGCTTKAMNEAASNGHLDVVMWLHENRTEGCTTWAMDHAAYGRHFEVVKWLHENRTEGCTTRAMDFAASLGYLNFVEWLHANRTEGCTTRAVDWAVQGNLSAVVRFLLANRSESFSDFAIKHCRSAEIADMLISSISVEQKRKFLKRAIDQNLHGYVVSALRNSLGITDA